MKPSLDRALRLVWLAIGVLLLGAVAVSLVLLVAGHLRTRGATEQAVRAAVGRPAGEPREVVVGMPEPLRGTGTRIAFVEHASAAPAPRAGAGRRQGVVNVVFLDADGGARLLLERPALIREVRYPPADSGAADAHPGGWITYEIVFADGAAAAPDPAAPSALYLSTVDGRALRPVVEPPLRYRAHHPFGAGRILVYAAGADSPRQRAFVYDVAAGTLTPFAALDSVAGEAARLLGR